ncbi:CO dehydrogenase nickel-insertion accessory protein CooC [archaeon]|nr:MAG: CO dehydrogenase nickel-insertion accessory protein CooC [archaeon]HDM24329.1 CO dehydrogenase nickel-insertion accessory protein CooC [Candidatus Bathyarchaeota archaeon]
MKILVAGKGGTGKTTIASTLAILLSKSGYKVLVLDTDSVPNTAVSLGIDVEEASKIVPLTMNDKLIQERTGAKPGEGWGVFFTLNPKVDDLIDKYGIRISEKLGLVVVGSIDASKQGCLCPAIALARHFLRHVLTSRDEIIIVDSEAGAEVFGRGLAEKFDMMLCITEPTVKSIGIALKLVKMAEELLVKQNVIVVNKVKDMKRAIKLCKEIIGDRVSYHLIRYDENIEELDYRGRGLNELPPNTPMLLDVKKLVEEFIPWIEVK